MPSRYTGRRVVVNADKTFERIFQDRNVNFVRQYKTPRLKHATAKQRAMLTRIRHIWKLGDRYWKLAAEHYGDSEKWWVIAWYNQKPTDFHVKSGDVVIIPQPLERALQMMKYF